MKIGIPFSFKRFFLVALILSFGQGFSQTAACTALNAPANGSTDVALDANFSWLAPARVVSYSLIAGTSPGATDILNNIDVGNVTEYDLPDYLPAGQTIYVRVVSKNSFGENPGCTEISFTTVANEILDCVDLTRPIEGSVDVAIDTAIEWTSSPNANGYRITIGSSTGNNDIIDNMDVGNSTSFQLPGGFNLLTSVFVTIVPYDSNGGNVSCSKFRFTTTSGMVPRCTQIINPQDAAELVPVNANITWIRDFTATGYLMTIREKEPDGAFILNEEDVGNGTNYKPPNFKPRTRYFVTMIPYNGQGNALGCEAITFTTGDPLPLPDCAEWVFPINGSSGVGVNTIFEWNEVPDTDGFILSVGTSLNGTELVNMEDVGDSTSYLLSEDLPMGATIYVKVNTYHGDEISESCPIISFMTEGPDPSDLQDDIPQFFTPNNDGFNDLWTIVSTENISINRVYIFDRHGKLLKQMGEGQGWDGTFNGKTLPADSYWYSVEFLNATSLSGYFLLKR